MVDVGVVEQLVWEVLPDVLGLRVVQEAGLFCLHLDCPEPQGRHVCHLHDCWLERTVLVLDGRCHVLGTSSFLCAHYGVLKLVGVHGLLVELELRGSP